MTKLVLSLLVCLVSALTMLGLIEAGREAHAAPSVVFSQASAPVAIEPMPVTVPSAADPYAPVPVGAPGSRSAGGVAVPSGGSGSAVTTTTTTTTTTATPVLPDPVEAPGDSASLLYKLYKAGHLVPALIIGAFFLLLLLRRWIAWLRTGYRALIVASTLGGLGMLAERVADGTTPSFPMIMGALGVALALYVKAEGEPKKPEPAKA